MKRTKTKARNTLSSSRNIGTQTESIDSIINMAKLEEQVRVLQLENNVLRKHMEVSNRPNDIVHHKTVHIVPQATPKTNVEKSGCGCKGNCSSRICGCVKKSNKCNPSCKCDDKMCQNQKSENQENKENVNRINVTPKSQSKKKNITTERIKTTRSLFSPDMKEIYKDLEENQCSDIHFSFNENTVVKNSQTDSHINAVEKEKKEEKKEYDKKQQESMIFDPMKPRHQLSRTPPKKLEKSLEVKDTIQSYPYSKPTEKVMIKSFLKDQDIKEEKIDWEEHTAQLIPCKKCKRTFRPDRIQKHEACCIKI